jgi:hypothetical protein
VPETRVRVVEIRKPETGGRTIDVKPDASG